MKAVFFEQHGGLDVVRYGDLPDPVPALGEALIKVRAVALNHLDVWVRRGWDGLRLSFPHITGSDVVGDIISVRADSTYAPGTRVVVNPGLRGPDDSWTRRGLDSVSPGYRILGEQVRGALAEYVTVPLANVYKAPEGFSDEELAALPLCGLTCWRMLFRRAALQPGERVLLVGAGGGVNSLALLLAKKIGCEVFVLAGGEEKSDRARTLGADVVIDYRANPRWDIEVLKLTRGYGADVVVDNVGEKTLAKSLRAVARGGRIVTVGSTSGPLVQFDNRLLFTKQVSILGSTMGSSQDFIDAMEFLWRHKIVAPIDRVAPLREAVTHLGALEAGEQFGKIVLKP